MSPHAAPPSALAVDRRERLRRTRLYLVAGSETGGPAWSVAVEQALASGVIGVLQLREKHLDDAAYLERAHAARVLCDACGALLIVNDRVSLAVAGGADGAHVGEHDLPPGVARLLLGPERLLGLSTHDAAELEAAPSLGADYAGLGPCFATESKTLTRAPQGPGLVAAALAPGERLPVFPIGGITLANAPALIAAGARRLAVGAAVLRAQDPAVAARKLAELLPPLV